MPPAVPLEIRTPRLLMRPWRPADAPRLLPVLQANVARLGGWIPAQVAMPAPLPELETRLGRFAEEFASNRAWRYALFSPDEATLFGEADLFPRTATSRVPLAEADRVEVGYWLREEATGQGLATEASEALLRAAASLPGITLAEIRCDERNTRSAAIPERLGFHLAFLQEGDQVWYRDIVVDRGSSPIGGTRAAT